MEDSSETIDVRMLDRPAGYMPADQFPQNSGGECVFFGRTRIESHPQFGELVQLVYEAYTPLAMQVLAELAEQARVQFGCSFVRIHHATGPVPPGSASVYIQTICPHRAAAFDACRFIIDELKMKAPIWKREIWQRGHSWSEGTPVRADGET